MALLEAILAVALFSLAAIGFLEIAELQLLRGQAERFESDVKTIQGALIRHQRANPQDGVETWLPAGSPWTDLSTLTQDRAALFDLGLLKRMAGAITTESGLGRSPFRQPYVLEANGDESFLRLRTQLTGRKQAATALLALRAFGPTITPRVSPSHGESQPYTVTVPIHPSLTRVLRAYTLDETDDQGGLGGPLFFLEQHLVSGGALTNACGSGGAVTAADEGLVRFCEANPTTNLDATIRFQSAAPVPWRYRDGLFSGEPNLFFRNFGTGQFCDSQSPNRIGCDGIAAGTITIPNPDPSATASGCRLYDLFDDGDATWDDCVEAGLDGTNCFRRTQADCDLTP